MRVITEDSYIELDGGSDPSLEREISRGGRVLDLENLRLHCQPSQQLLSSYIYCRCHSCECLHAAVSDSSVEQSEKKAFINDFNTVNQYSKTQW